MKQNHQTIKKPDVDLNQSRFLINQWLVYAFWGLNGLALAWLASGIFDYLLTSGNQKVVIGDSLFPLIIVFIFSAAAITQDIVYSKHECQRKTGTAAKLMIAHTVLFAIASIISLVIAVFAGISIFTDPNINTNSQLASTLTATVVAIYFTALTVRTIAIKKPNQKQLISFRIMVSLSILSLTVHIYGPAVKSILTHKDQALDSGVYLVSSSIEDYARKNHELPKSIDEIYIDSQTDAVVKSAIKDGLIKYLPNTKPSEVGKSFYQLCATYQQPKGNPQDITAKEDDIDGHSYRPSTKNRDSGEVCYKLYALHLTLPDKDKT